MGCDIHELEGLSSKYVHLRKASRLTKGLKEQQFTNSLFVKR